MRLWWGIDLYDCSERECGVLRLSALIRIAVASSVVSPTQALSSLRTTWDLREMLAEETKQSRAARLSAALIWLYRPPAPSRFFTISALRIAINFRFEVFYGILCAEKNCENRELIALYRTFLWAIPRTLKVRYFFFFQRTKILQRTVLCGI